MKNFLLVFEDSMDMRVIPEGRNSKPVTRRVEAESRQQLISQMGLVPRKNSFTDFYWDGKTGDVVISIHEIPEEVLFSQAELNRLVFELHCDWY